MSRDFEFWWFAHIGTGVVLGVLREDPQQPTLMAAASHRDETQWQQLRGFPVALLGDGSKGSSRPPASEDADQPDDAGRHQRIDRDGDQSGRLQHEYALSGVREDATERRNQWRR